MVYIYARVSTDGQTVDSQLQSIKDKYPGAQVVTETVSGWKDKPVLNALLGQLQRSDVLVVAALDRLGRHARKALGLLEELNDRGIKVVSLREGIDTTSSSGKFVATCMFGLAEMERNLISERTKAGVARARAEGKQIGRRKLAPGEAPPPHWKRIGGRAKFPSETIAAVHEAHKRGLSIRKINELTGVSASRIHQLLKGGV